MITLFTCTKDGIQADLKYYSIIIAVHFVFLVLRLVSAPLILCSLACLSYLPLCEHGQRRETAIWAVWYAALNSYGSLTLKKERVIALDPINEGSSIVYNMGSDCLAQS